MRRTFTVIAVAAIVAVGCSSNSTTANTPSSTKSATDNTSAGPTKAETDALAAEAGLTGAVNFDSDPKNQVATPTDGSVEVEISDNYIGPTFINAKRGTTLHVTLTNAGKNTHSFTIDALHIEKVLAPGAKSSVDVAVPATGALRFYCKYHQSMGMQGALIVTT